MRYYSSLGKNCFDSVFKAERKEISKEKFYSLRRRKNIRERAWINGGNVVARELVY